MIVALVSEYGYDEISPYLPGGSPPALLDSRFYTNKTVFDLMDRMLSRGEGKPIRFEFDAAAWKVLMRSDSDELRLEGIAVLYRDVPIELYYGRGIDKMIKLILGPNNPENSQLIDSMLRNRADTFGERLGWEVHVQDGRERDYFDELDPLYVILVDPVNGEYQASLRLLPTTGPNMLHRVFPQLLNVGETIASNSIWESSRICSQKMSNPRERIYGMKTLPYLIAGMAEVGIKYGLTQIISVVDQRIYRALKMVRMPIIDIGKPQIIGDVLAHAIAFDIVEPRELSRLKLAAGLSDEKLISESVVGI